MPKLGLPMKLFFVVLLAATLCAPARADDPPSPPERTKQWQKLTPEERERLRQRWHEFQKLPPERQQELRERVNEFRKLPPEERVRVRKNFERWQQLSPEEKQRIREKYQRFQQLPPEEKQKLREKAKPVVEAHKKTASPELVQLLEAELAKARSKS